MRVHAKDREEVASLKAGDIAALIGMKHTTTGDTLCDEEHPIVLETIHCPETVIDLKIESPSAKEREKLSIALHKLALEDPSFRVRYDDKTEETVISGMGELHLEVIVDTFTVLYPTDVYAKPIVKVHR